MSEITEKEYDFVGKNPDDLLTSDEVEHFEEGMRLKNKSVPAESIDFKRAAQSVVKDLDRLFP
jgi:hypothetical protein